MKERIQFILDAMTLEDKIALCSGADAWHTKAMDQYGIPSVMMTDGPHGLRKQDSASNLVNINHSVPSTAFPTAVSTGSSWDPELVEQVGQAIGEEALEQQVSLVLGPGLNLKRNPLCGRNFEYFSEDPLLAGKLAGAMIRGIQSQGVGACMKHFAANNQEYKRFTSDSVVDERTLRELYLAGFEIAVKEGHPRSAMCGYNKLNGVHCSDSVYLMTRVLRQQWGFDGMVVTDWGAMSDRIEGFRAGCDLSMPGGSAYMEQETLEAVRSGKLSEKLVDESARRVLRLVLESQPALSRQHTFSREEHHELACRAAEQSAVLLKNEDQLLPLKPGARVALIGDMAKNFRYQGAGSSHITPTKLETLFDCLEQAVYAPGCNELGQTDETLLAQALQAAEGADAVVLCVGLTPAYESEGFDRDHMRLPEGHIRLIEQVSQVNENVAVVLLSGSPVETPWRHLVKSILFMGLSGQAGGRAAANLLWGRVSPSGRLAESWPERYEDCPSSQTFAKGIRDAQYREGIYMGYRYYDKAEVPVAFPFGHGLSYTSFRWSDWSLSRESASVTVTNTGSRSGGEVVELYVAMPQTGLHRPVKELKAFRKIWLAPGESQRVTIPFHSRMFALWSEGWKIPAGSYAILMGPRPEALKELGSLTLQGDCLPIPQWQPGSWYQQPKGQPPKEDWEAMLGRRHEERLPAKGEYTMQSTILEMKQTSRLMQVLFKTVEKIFASQYGGKVDYSIPEFRMMMASSTDCSMSAIQILAGIRGHAVNALVELANGRPRQAARLLKEK